MDLKNFFLSLQYREGLSAKFEKKQVERFFRNRILMPNQMDYISAVGNTEIDFIDGIQQFTGYKDKKFDVFKLMDLIEPQDFENCMTFIDTAFNEAKKIGRKPFSVGATIIYRIKVKGGIRKTVMREATSASIDDNCNMTSHYSIIKDVSHLKLSRPKAWWVSTNGIHKLPLSGCDVKFTKREMEVLEYIAKGLTSKEIAEKLSIAKLTVDKHRENLKAKADVRNSSQLIDFAYSNDLIDLDF